MISQRINRENFKANQSFILEVLKIILLMDGQIIRAKIIILLENIRMDIESQAKLLGNKIKSNLFMKVLLITIINSQGKDS